MVESDISDSDPVLLLGVVEGVEVGSAGVVLSVKGGSGGKDGLSDRPFGAVGHPEVAGPGGGVPDLLVWRERWRLAPRSLWDVAVLSSNPPDLRSLMGRAGAGVAGRPVGVGGRPVMVDGPARDEVTKGSGAWTVDAQGRTEGCSKAEVSPSTSTGCDGALPATRSKGEVTGSAWRDRVGSSREATDHGQSSLPLLPCDVCGGVGVVVGEGVAPGVGSGP